MHHTHHSTTETVLLDRNNRDSVQQHRVSFSRTIDRRDYNNGFFHVFTGFTQFRRPPVPLHMARSAIEHLYTNNSTYELLQVHVAAVILFRRMVWTPQKRWNVVLSTKSYKQLHRNNQTVTLRIVYVFHKWRQRECMIDWYHKFTQLLFRHSHRAIIVSSNEWPLDHHQSALYIICCTTTKEWISTAICVTVIIHTMSLACILE